MDQLEYWEGPLLFIVIQMTINLNRPEILAHELRAASLSNVGFPGLCPGPASNTKTTFGWFFNLGICYKLIKRFMEQT